jgi:acyl-CoA dehydrogenase
MVLGLSFGRLASVPVRRDKRLAGYYRKLARYSAALAFCADIAMLTLGGKLKQKERLSARLGDVLSWLYMCSAALYRYEAQGRPFADQALLAWGIHYGVDRMQDALHGFIDNFPNRALATVMRFTVFPLGRWERAPGDRLSHRVAALLLTPSEARERLTNGVFVDLDSDHPISFMEKALPRVIAAEPLERRLAKAVKAGEVTGITWEEQIVSAVAAGVLEDEEAAELSEVREMVQEIIAVDDFDSEDLRLGRQAPAAAVVSEEPPRSNAA